MPELEIYCTTRNTSDSSRDCIHKVLCKLTIPDIWDFRNELWFLSGTEIKPLSEHHDDTVNPITHIHGHRTLRFKTSQTEGTVEKSTPFYSSVSFWIVKSFAFSGDYEQQVEKFCRQED